MRWYSPFDWILGPETEEEIEELEKLKNSKEKESSSAAAGGKYSYESFLKTGEKPEAIVSS